MKTKHAFVLTVIGCVIIGIAAAWAQTILSPSQVGNVPHLPSQFGFACTTVGPTTVCQVDPAYMLHLLPIPAPAPGICNDSGGVVVTSEPAAYFWFRLFRNARPELD
jgi:hypothetical protein